MNPTRVKRLAVFAVLVSLLVSVLQVVILQKENMPNIAAAVSVGSGNSWVATYEEKKVLFSLINHSGVTLDYFSIPRQSKNEVVQIASMAVDGSGNVYFISHYSDLYTGKRLEKQELSIYTPSYIPFGKIKTIELSGFDNRVNSDLIYKDLYASTSLVIGAVNADQTLLTRISLDYDGLRAGKSVIKQISEYPLLGAEGYHKSVPMGEKSIYLSKSGKIYVTSVAEDKIKQIYPVESSSNSFAYILSAGGNESVYINQQYRGGFLRLYTDDGQEEYIKEGSQSFTNLAFYYRDIVDISLHKDSYESFTAVVQNSTDNTLHLIVSDNGTFSIIDSISDGIWYAALHIAVKTVLYSATIIIVFLLISLLIKAIIESRTIMVKLFCTAVPLLAVALMLFGVYSYKAYEDSFGKNYISTMEDQGNLLRALFESVDIEKITSPSSYSSSEYKYILSQMNTREIHTSSAYFIDFDLYTAADNELPALFPYGINKNYDKQELYRLAALTGKQQSGVISDEFGERIACITPVGSSYGNAVFLLETSVFSSAVRSDANKLIRNYLVISSLCLVGTALLLFLIFGYILIPLRAIIDGMEKYTDGDRSIRLKAKSNDELANISRVFNQMANDTDVQIYNLKNLSDTYYRYIPKQIFDLMGKDNLSDLQLGTGVQSDYCVLSANLYIAQNRFSVEQIEDITNAFFSIVHDAANQHQSTVIADSVNLRSLKLICPDADNAVSLAMDAIANIDSHNAMQDLYMRLDASFFLHSAPIYFGICGNNDRFIPAILSDEFDEISMHSEELRQLSSRLIVTENAYKKQDNNVHFHRFIGNVQMSGGRVMGLYDFYDSSSPTVIQLFNNTKPTFDKAMELYDQKRYYDAKNLFAIVLRENKQDNVARRYIFQCEEKI